MTEIEKSVTSVVILVHIRVMKIWQQWASLTCPLLSWHHVSVGGLWHNDELVAIIELVWHIHYCREVASQWVVCVTGWWMCVNKAASLSCPSSSWCRISLGSSCPVAAVTVCWHSSGKRHSLLPSRCQQRWHQPSLGLSLRALHSRFIIGPPNGRVLFCLLTSVVVVCNSAGVPAWRLGGRPPPSRARGRSTIHGGPVQLRHLVDERCDNVINWIALSTEHTAAMATLLCTNWFFQPCFHFLHHSTTGLSASLPKFRWLFSDP